MNSKNYATLFLNKLTELLGRNYHWQTQTINGGMLMASANVPTVVGTREVGIFFNGEQVWATLVLAGGAGLEYLSHEELLELVYGMNNVTLTYGNLVSPIFADDPNGNGINVFLRSVVYGTSQNDPNFNNDEECREMLLVTTAGLICDFITFINNDVGTTVLEIGY